ncbi:MAG: DNA-binding transcriptional regulator [Planctomycetia bacterium]|nr:DNA-binding transcriptional regulator [Planctomycetia bacterium]
MLIIETTTGFGRGIFRGITSYVRERKHWQINIENRGFFDPLPTWLKDWKGHGIISRSGNASMIRFLQRFDVPVVELFGNNSNIPSEVYCDRMKTAELALSHFQNCGLRHIAFYTHSNSWWIRLRQESFVQCCQNAGINVHLLPPLETEKFIDNAPEWDSNDERRLLRWLKTLPKPIGILAGFDAAAIRVINACQKLGIVVPEEVAVLGVGNDDCLCDAITPSLSSININSYGIGYEAARLLDEKMDRRHHQPQAPIRVTPVGLVERGSTNIIHCSNPDIAQAIRFMRDNATSGVRVADVLNAVNLSARTLQRAFLQLLNRTPEQELIRLKMEHACMLLRETQLNLHEIAFASGFASLKYFINSFRKVHGMTPSMYRRNTFHS